MKLGITGAATYRDYSHFKQVVEAIPVPITLIVTGGREGTEAMARRYGREHEIAVLIHHRKASDTVDWLIGFNLVLVADADNLLAFQYPGTQTSALLKTAARVAGKRLNTVYLEPDSKPHAIAARYGEEI